MFSTSDHETPLHRSEPFLTKIGLLSAFLAAVSTPIADGAGVLYFVLGFYISVSFPSLFGFAAVLIGLQQFRVNSRRKGTLVILVGILGAAVGMAYGITTIS